MTGAEPQVRSVPLHPVYPSVPGISSRVFGGHGGGALLCCGLVLSADSAVDADDASCMAGLDCWDIAGGERPIRLNRHCCGSRLRKQ